MGKAKSGFPGKGRCPSPASDPVLAQQGQKSLLSRLVAAPFDEGHDLGSLGFAPNIHKEILRCIVPPGKRVL